MLYYINTAQNPNHTSYPRLFHPPQHQNNKQPTHGSCCSGKLLFWCDLEPGPPLLLKAKGLLSSVSPVLVDKTEAEVLLEVPCTAVHRRPASSSPLIALGKRRSALSPPCGWVESLQVALGPGSFQLIPGRFLLLTTT